MLKRFAALLLSAVLPLLACPRAGASAYDGHPKLVVILVIDQFRADYLQRYRSDFKGRGFRLFLDKGAYFPDCYYGYANTKTAPGHATIGTGAYTDGHGINSNEWWDLQRNKQRPVSSVEDERYGLIGVSASLATPVSVQGEEAGQATAPKTAKPPTGETGASPRNLLASTIGGELRLATNGASRVYGVSLKDRAAILPAGSTANGAFWIDPVSGRFITSSYYMTELPQWAADFDAGPAAGQSAAAANVTNLTNFYKQVGSTDAANSYEIAFAEALIAGEELGTRDTTDLLTLSLSPNDLEGHRYGPDSPEEHAMIDALDTDLDSFAGWLDKHVPGGLANVVLTLTADHGIAPTPDVSSALGLPGVYINIDKLVADLNQAINAKFSPGENVVYLLPHQSLPYLSLNRPSFERAGIIEREAENAVQSAMTSAFTSLAASGAEAKPKTPAEPPAAPSETTGAAVKTTVTVQAPPRIPPNPQLFRAYTREQLAAGQVPPTDFGQLMARSYSPNGGWYVAVFPVEFQMEGNGSGGTTHFSPYAYDRHVPLGFYGAPFVPGTYRGHVEPVDLAVTLASVLGVNEPSAAVGHVLTQALKPVGEFIYPKPPTVRHGTRRAGHATSAPPTEKPKQP